MPARETHESLTDAIDATADDATHAVIAAWETHGLDTGDMDLEAAMFSLNDLLTAWLRDHLRQSKPA